MKFKSQILWALLLITIPLSVIDVIGDLLKIAFLQVDFFNLIILYIPLILLLLHAIWTLSFSRGILFIFIACLVGFIFEFLGLNYGVIFGGVYTYSLPGLKILTVPLNVILCWGLFIYTGYCISNSFLFWLNKDKPAKNKKNSLILPLLVLFDSLIVLAIDLFMDPLQVKAGGWAWLDEGLYFKIPIGNFVGWILVVMIVTGFFRTYEYFKPMATDKKLKSIFLIPVLGYGALYFNFLISAFNFGMISLSLIGSVTMLPIVIINLFLFRKFKKSKINES